MNMDDTPGVFSGFYQKQVMVMQEGGLIIALIFHVVLLMKKGIRVCMEVDRGCISVEGARRRGLYSDAVVNKALIFLRMVFFPTAR